MSDLTKLPLKDRLQLVEDVWDSIAAEQEALALTEEQKAELDRRLAAYRTDGNKGRDAREVIADIRKRI